MRARGSTVARAAMIAALSLAALGASRPAQAEVRVRYVAPERFTDAEDGFGSGPPLRVTLAEMTGILRELGRRTLRPGEDLDLTILDIDRAGFVRPGAFTGNDVRVVNEATPPRIRLAYTLTRGGRVLKQGEDLVTDINFLLAANSRFSTGALHYERIVLREWFARTFPAAQEGVRPAR